MRPGDRTVPATLLALACSCCGGAQGEAAEAVRLQEVAAVEWEWRGAWLAPRSDAGMDSDAARATLGEMAGLGVGAVAVGWDVHMPAMAEPELRWGEADAELRAVLRRVRAAGMRAMLMPRIESPDFFREPYPFRADIGFDDAGDWDAFHDDVRRMVVHYAALAREEQVALYCIGLELEQSVLGHAERWRRIIAAAREEFPGPLTYSANWYEEWDRVEFWDALDYVGIGAYFELRDGTGDAEAGPVGDLVARWRPIRERLEAFSREVGRPILFTEIGYTGYADTAERPWEWAGKQDRGVRIDHHRQAQAFAALFSAFAENERLAGAFLWTFYTKRSGVEDWEYAIGGRPAEAVVRRAYRGR